MAKSVRFKRREHLKPGDLVKLDNEGYMVKATPEDAMCVLPNGVQNIDYVYIDVPTKSPAKNSYPDINDLIRFLSQTVRQ